MVLVLCLAAVIWGIGIRMKAPVRQRLILIGILWLAVIVEQLLLREGHPLREATGGSAQVWLAVGLIVALVAGYALGLSALKRRAQPKIQPDSTPGAAFTPAELDRYSRHILLREIGGPGQRRLKDAKVLVIGAGGLGAPSLLYLAAAGVGRIGVIDDDTVDSSNLQRQIIHADARIGMTKVQSAAEAMRALNPFVDIRTYTRRLDEAIAPELFAGYDLVLDGTDNFDTRYLANRAAVAAQKPLIAAAITQWEGQLSLYDPAHGGPCYECVFPTRPAPGMVPTCAEAGVAGPLPGVLGSMMALEAVKQITGAGEGLRGKLLLFDGLHGESRLIHTRKRVDCPVCGSDHPA
ncbi:MAG: molybdopterin biosynthesis protein [Cereibacter sphaeroides]|uniref:Molybdopterin-synthase adenylyltransferase n=1 Tax=Cereibacter sphaeroides TaxID=1063 RepID=A0A2W5SBM8_CERSP|nr:MAG: molybdopterin biosynthesis protein [Cereibacter sphaeroides]